MKLRFFITTAADINAFIKSKRNNKFGFKKNNYYSWE